MKVNLDMTLEVTDEERVKIGDLLDGKQSKRVATRTELKEWIWNEGSSWKQTLIDRHFEQFAAPAEDPAPQDATDPVELDDNDLI